MTPIESAKAAWESAILRAWCRKSEGIIGVAEFEADLAIAFEVFKVAVDAVEFGAKR